MKPHKHADPDNEVDYWRKKAEHLEQENFAWRTKLGVRGYEIEIESLRQALDQLPDTTKMIERTSMTASELADRIKRGEKWKIAEPDTGIDRGAWDDVPDATKWVDELRGDEPVAKVCHNLPQHIGWNPKITHLPDEGTPLYTAPQKREWQGLTDDERGAIMRQFGVWTFSNEWLACLEVEAKLKEKNSAS